MEDLNIDIHCDVIEELEYRWRKASLELLKNTQAKKVIPDAEFCDIYNDAIEQILGLQDAENSARFRRYLAYFDDFASDWCEFTKTNFEAYDSMVDALMDSLYYRAVYIYRNALLLTSAISLHFGAVLDENPDVTRRLLQKETLRICSVGGGSASDVVAIVSVLERIAKGMDLDIRVTVVDSDGRWKMACLAVLRCLRQFRCGIWKIDFIQSDLSEKNLNSEVVKAIRSADVVTMGMFLSEFEQGHEDVQGTLKNINQTVSPGSLLLALDVSDSDYIEACGGHTGELDSYQLMYEDICYLHTLDLDAIRKIILYYQKHFSALQINSCLDLFVRIWLKTEPARPKISERQLQMCFRRNLDQYNLRETFVDEKFFQNWAQQFTKEMSTMGWSRVGIWYQLQKRKSFMDDYLKDLIGTKTDIDFHTKKLMYEDSVSNGTVGTCSRKIVGQFTKEEWEDYLNDKYKFANMKEYLYSLSILSLYNHITRTMNLH